MRICALAPAMAFAVWAAGPQPPCGGEAVPGYPAAGAAPAVQVWDREAWNPPPCMQWEASSASTLVTTVARFRQRGGVEALRRRVGAISQMKGLLYWSTTQQRWQPMILEAAAIDGPSGAPRQDFAAEEVAPDRVLYLQQQDSLLGKVTYRLRIREASASRLVFATENSTTVTYFGLPVAHAGELQSVCFLERESGEVWRYYAIARTGKGVSLLTSGHDASLINRAAATFRRIAGIPADQEPPAAR